MNQARLRKGGQSVSGIIDASLVCDDWLTRLSADELICYPALRFAAQRRARAAAPMNSARPNKEPAQKPTPTSWIVTVIWRPTRDQKSRARRKPAY